MVCNIMYDKAVVVFCEEENRRNSQKIWVYKKYEKKRNFKNEDTSQLKWPKF